MIEAAAVGDMTRLKEVCENFTVKDVSQIRCKIEIPDQMLVQMFGQGVKIREKYKPRASWNPALYAIAANKVEVIKYLVGTLKANPRVCFTDHHHESDTVKD